ncbi:5-hydroxytryptamine receptor 6-like [Paramacrobiotus metropolitanus]|uniref:5-hydroxytryptamine receptor 6-like n=1 Tax=Paramacrobiotus metropolitanus TaxID=2943436 RepID=UPI0024460A78|nr:5-hydroxytryptamine receptor 6-like [Paramacrobiotus metropolitanus]
MNATLNNITTNASVAAVPSTADWNYPAVSSLIWFILQLVLNVSMLLFLVRHKTLRTGFNVYLIGLLSTNVFFAVGVYPSEILEALYGRWWMPRGTCSLFIYCIWVMAGVAMHMHVLITVNRLWALTFPLSYRNRHNTKVACLLAVGMVAYVHIVCFPIFLIDELYYRPAPGEFGCYLNAAEQTVYALATDMVAFNLPVVIVLFSYPYILYKFLRRRRARTAASTASPMPIDGSHNQANSNKIAPASSQPTTATSHKNDGSVRPFLILTLLTCSIAICWAPAQLYFTLDGFMEAGFMSVSSSLIQLKKAALFLYPMQAILDPIVFALSLSNLRSVILKWWDKSAAPRGRALMAP